MKKSLVLSVVAAAAFAVCLTGCGAKKAAAEKGSGDAEPVFAVNTYKIVPTSLDDYLEFGGDVDTVSAVSVMPDTAGKISRINVKVGDRVTKDQIIAAVDASRPGMVFADSPVRAPVSGTITYFPGVIGTSVSQSSVIAKISSTNELEIQTAVPERFISRISMNQKAVLTFSAYPGETFAAHIKEVSPVLDSNTRTMTVKLAIDKRDARIKIGMYAKIHLVTEHKQNVTVVPYGTVVTQNGETYVFKVMHNGAENTVSLVPVQLGIRVDNFQEILEGIKEGDEIVIKGQSLLNNGAKVNVVSVAGN